MPSLLAPVAAMWTLPDPSTAMTGSRKLPALMRSAAGHGITAGAVGVAVGVAEGATVGVAIGV
jgi:hypothetical protein